jgi:hypothetical protein
MPVSNSPASNSPVGMQPPISALVSRCRALVRAKMGRCPRCMRLSMLGSLISWSVCATLYLAWPNRVALAVTLTLSIAFTLLAATHLVTFMFRMAALMRAHVERPVSNESPAGRRLSRRELTVTVCRAGLAFCLAAIFGSRSASGQLKCAGHHKTGPTVVQASDADETVARRELHKRLVTHCDGVCANADCPSGRCRSDGHVGLKGEKEEKRITCTFNNNTKQFTCRAEVVACACDCFACAGGQKPNGAFTEGLGTGATKAAATTAAGTDATTTCTDFCARFFCPQNGQCITDVLELGGVSCKQVTPGVWHCTQKINKCTCKCGGT